MSEKTETETETLYYLYPHKTEGLLLIKRSATTNLFFKWSTYSGKEFSWRTFDPTLIEELNLIPIEGVLE